MFKALLILFFLTSFEISKCQTPLVALPDSLGKNLGYYSPTYIVKAKAAYRGVLEIGQPFDSLEWGERSLTEPLTRIQTNELSKLQKGLLIIWDTIQEWECLEFMASPRGKQKFSPAKYVPVCRNDKEISGLDIKTIAYKGMPVYILNNTDGNLRISFPKYGLMIFQEALDKTGKWKRIEEPFLMPKGYTKPTTFRFIKPGQFILTTVYKYKGGFSTQLRLCLETGAHKIYSQPFAGSINYSQFKDEPMRQTPRSCVSGLKNSFSSSHHLTIL